MSLLSENIRDAISHHHCMKNPTEIGILIYHAHLYSYSNSSQLHLHIQSNVNILRNGKS